MTELALAGMKSPPDVIVCANDDMALGALVALKSRNLVGKVALIGFDALPRSGTVSSIAWTAPTCLSMTAFKRLPMR